MLSPDRTTGGLVTGDPDLEMSIADLIAACPYAGAALARRGMACVGCPMARFESVTEAAAAYGADPIELLRDAIGQAPRYARPPSLRGRKDAGRQQAHYSRRRVLP
jgi:hybrid cluster-associated redox disulfide protein